MFGVSTGGSSDGFIDATEVVPVNLAVSGFDVGAAAAATFGGASNHHSAVAPGSSGTTAANFSNLGEGAITIASGSNGAETNSTGNSAPPVSDGTSQTTLSVDATNPSHVTFTVAGLPSDYSGTVTFTDSSGRQDVVAINSNGAYAANLSNLTDGTITYLLQATDPAGHVITVDPPLNLGDGSSNAPAGSPELPNLLSGEAVRPTWNVAGVDYSVGISQGTVLRDPFAGGTLASALVAMGGSANASNHVITFSGVNNAVISGYDFSLEGGWTVQILSNNATITNCNFKVGANLRPPILVDNSVNNVTITNNVIDGAGIATNPSGGLLVLNAQGTTTLEYNVIENAYYQLIEAGPSTNGASSQIIQYNLMQNAGLGAPQGAHGDWVQDFVVSPSQQFADIEINFNTLIQNNASAATQGLSILSAGGQSGGSALKEGISNNTVVVTSNVNYPFIVDNTWLNGTATVSNNYVDQTGVLGSYLFAGAYNGVGTDGPYNGTVNTFNNINMTTGSYYSQSLTSVRQVVTNPSSGTEVPGNTITLTVDFSAAVNVTGTPTLKLNDGGTATYTGGSGTNALTFKYTVGASDTAVSALAVTSVNLAGGATIKDGGGNAADLTNALTTFWKSATGTPPGPTLTSVVESSLDRRSECRQDGHADAQSEFGGDGGGRHSVADAQRWWGCDLYRRLWHKRAYF